MSTKEEALKKALEQKKETRFDTEAEDLQQLVEDAVRRAIADPLSEEEGAARSPLPAAEDSSRNHRAPLEDSCHDDPGGSVFWQSGIDTTAVNIRLKTGKGGKGVILFVSSVPGEGTTTLCAHVGQALARVTKPAQVLVMDCHARNPEIHKIFKTEAVPGVAEIIEGKISWPQALRKGPRDNFFILPFGQKGQDLMLIQDLNQMEALLKSLKENFDFILIDGPPILTGVAAEMLASRVEHVILVIKAQATRREVVLRAAGRVSRYREFMGAILNRQDGIPPPPLQRKGMPAERKFFQGKCGPNEF